ncbi:MAG: hypothetical protein H6836_08165 [Planctomycetes bacterium]|nr:hypothetical protein [Planctomycetota bacterium]MCB9889539.1 hypothetical protein [Planctomycetota bacterium]
MVPTTCPPTPLGARNDLFGWVSNSPAGEIDVQTTHDYGCTAVKKCPGVLVPATNAIAGGSAYDPRFQAAWSSDGINLSLDGLRNCDLICRGVAVRILGATSVVSGLAVHDSAQRLYQLETVPGAFGVVTYDIKDPKTTCFQAIDRCTGKTVTANGVAGGLAYDEGRGLLFLSTSEPGAATWSHFIHVFRAAAPCQPVCRWQITGNCMTTLGPVTGLAYDNCASMLYATDGIQVLEIAVGDPTQCQFRSARCCSAVARYRGLALTSGWTLEHIGRNCLLKPCASCPNMYLRTTGGDPSLGNTSFGLQLVNAPGGPGQFAGLYLRVGGCTAGFPLFCSSFHAYPGVGPFITPLVGASCSGTATWPLPIPPVAAYCGIKLCAQALVICQSSPGTGVGVSNALQFPITN